MTHAYPAPALRNLITLFTMMGGFMTQLDTTIANVALPHMQATTAASHEQITWVLTSYIVMAAMLTPLAGWLATRFGRRKVVITSVIGFTLASVLCGLAANFDQLIAFRILQGVLGAALLPMSQAIMIDINPPDRRGKAMALWGMGAVMGPILGPVLGGWPVLAALSLDFSAGQTTVLLGPSGSGKSSLLRLVAGLLPMQAHTRGSP